MTISRRDFLKRAAVPLAVAGVPGAAGLAARETLSPAAAGAKRLSAVVPNTSGVQSYFTLSTTDTALMARAGFRWSRHDLGWSDVEKKKGQYDFATGGYDARTHALLSRGIRPIYILDSSNALYGEHSGVQTAAGRQGFAAFAGASAAHYKGHGIVWEIWNEPNSTTFWDEKGPSYGSYAQLVAAAVPAIRKADPTGIVAAPAVAQFGTDFTWTWTEGAMQSGILRHTDVVSVHPYRQTAPETVVADYARLRGLIRKYAHKDIPIVVTEWGYGSGYNYGSGAINDTQQAEFLARVYLINQWQRVPITIWYAWWNDDEPNFDLVQRMGSPASSAGLKPAYHAAQAVSHTLSGYHATGRLKAGDDGDYVLTFKNVHGHKAYAFWTTHSSHQLALPVGAGSGTLVQMLGGKQRVTWTKSGLQVTLSTSPQYLV